MENFSVCKLLKRFVAFMKKPSHYKKMTPEEIAFISGLGR
jgi:hypothetical protein